MRLILSLLVAFEAHTLCSHAFTPLNIGGKVPSTGLTPVSSGLNARPIKLLGVGKKSTATVIGAKEDSVDCPEPCCAGETASEEEIRSLFTLWNSALQTGKPKVVTNLYAKDAVLLPTVSDTPRTDHDLIEDYFKTFLQRKPQGTILESFVKIGSSGEWAKDSGIYEFAMGGKCFGLRFDIREFSNRDLMPCLLSAC